VDVSEGITYLEHNGLPNYVFPEDAARTMAAMIRYRENMKPHEGRRREVFRLLEDKEKAAAVIAAKLSGRKEYFMTEKEAMNFSDATDFLCSRADSSQPLLKFLQP